MKSRRKSLLNQEQQPSVAQSASKARRATAAFALSLIAGILFIINGILRILQSRALEISGIEDEIRRRILAGIALHLVGAIAVVFGVLVIVGAVLIHKPGKETTGGNNCIRVLYSKHLDLRSNQFSRSNSRDNRCGFGISKEISPPENGCLLI
jgi:hypothetical protein